MLHVFQPQATIASPSSLEPGPGAVGRSQRVVQLPCHFLINFGSKLHTFRFIRRSEQHPSTPPNETRDTIYFAGKKMTLYMYIDPDEPFFDK